MLTAPNFNVPIQSPASEWGPDLADGGLSCASAEIPHVRTAHSATTDRFQGFCIIGAFASWMYWGWLGNLAPSPTESLLRPITKYQRGRITNFRKLFVHIIL